MRARNDRTVLAEHIVGGDEECLLARRNSKGMTIAGGEEYKGSG